MTYQPPYPPSKRDRRRSRRSAGGSGDSGRGLGEFLGDLFEIAVDVLFGWLR